MSKFVKDVYLFWCHTWQNNKLLFIMEMIGTLLGMLAATMFMAEQPELFSIRIMYFISAILLAYTAHIRESSWMLLLMLFYAVTGLIGLINIL